MSEQSPRFRQVLDQFAGYKPGKAPSASAGKTFKLSSNESPYDPLPSVRAALAQMAFDHERILTDGVERARSKLEYTSLAAAFCRPEFTVADLRRVYEIVWGTPLDPRNFHRKVTSAEGFLVETGSVTSSGGGRPAQLYRRGTAVLLYPPMLRPGSRPPVAVP